MKKYIFSTILCVFIIAFVFGQEEKKEQYSLTFENPFQNKKQFTSNHIKARELLLDKKIYCVKTIPLFPLVENYTYERKLFLFKKDQLYKRHKMIISDPKDLIID